MTYRKPAAKDKYGGIGFVFARASNHKSGVLNIIYNLGGFGVGRIGNKAICKNKPNFIPWNKIHGPRV